MSYWRCHHCGHDFGARAESPGGRRCAKCGRVSDGQLTADQAKDIERNDRYIAREGLVSLMNATKWREAEEAIVTIMGRWPGWRAEIVRDGKPTERFDPDYYHFHAIPRKLIVYLEIDVVRQCSGFPPADHTEPIAAALKTLGVPFTREEGCLRIWGYARPGAFPTFAEYAKGESAE